MKRFKNILVYLPGQIGDEQALCRATELAQANGAHLTLLDVVVPTNGNSGPPFIPPSAEKVDFDDDRVAERLALLKRIAASHEAGAGETRAQVAKGRPFIEIVRTVLSGEHDLVIMAADSLQGVRLISLGATSMHLMRKCPCPVWVIKPSRAPRFKNVLAAIDASDTDPQARALNTKILQLGSSIARQEQCNFHISYAWRLSGSDAENVKSEISDSQMDDIYKRNYRENKALVLKALEGIELGNVEPSIHLPDGDPAAVIPTVAQENEIDLVVMGSVSRSGISGLLMGNTAELVLRQVNCSVLTAKPDGFETPITLE